MIMEGKKDTVGILAYGSLIDSPGKELEPLIVDRIHCNTPFNVEFARISTSRSNAPTLIPIQNGGKLIKAQILVLSDLVSIDRVKSMLWRRERHITDVSQNYSRPQNPGTNKVLIECLYNFYGIQNVFYTSIGINIGRIITPGLLADYAIESILGEAGAKGLDGIRYLLAAKMNGIVTGLSEEYENEILKRTSTESLKDAIQALDQQRNSIRKIHYQ